MQRYLLKTKMWGEKNPGGAMKLTRKERLLAHYLTLYSARAQHVLGIFSLLGTRKSSNTTTRPWDFWIIHFCSMLVCVIFSQRSTHLYFHFLLGTFGTASMPMKRCYLPHLQTANNNCTKRFRTWNKSIERFLSKPWSPISLWYSIFLSYRGK